MEMIPLQAQRLIRYWMIQIDIVCVQIISLSISVVLRNQMSHACLSTESNRHIFAERKLCLMVCVWVRVVVV